MKVVNLVLRGSLPFEDRESGVSEAALLRSVGGPVLARHVAVIGSGCAERKAVPFVVRTHAGEAGTTREFSLEMEDV